jgi:hypothetical protein
MTFVKERFGARTRCIRVEYDGDPAVGSARSRCFRVAQTVFGVGMTVEEPNDLSMRMRERLASATHAARRQLGVDIRELTLHVWIRTPTVPKVHVAAAGDVVLEFSLASVWRYAIWCGVLQANDMMTGRFPRLDPDALPPWADALWRLSVEGRLAALGVRMPLEIGGLGSQEWPASVATRRAELERVIADYTDETTARRLADGGWGAPVMWRQLCAIGKEARLPMVLETNKRGVVLHDST